MNSNEALNAYSYTNQDHQSYNEHLSYKAIIDECERLRQEIQRISDETYGPIDKSSTANTKLPFALILGNHSSGKSTFINYLLENNIQASGVAPTDDCFTIIGHGNVSCTRNGSALTGDPDLGFASLINFGPMLVHKTQLKLRSDLPSSLKDMMIVDSPGMIDAPIPVTSGMDQSSANRMDRGYDFSAVVRWYAERADVILLMFDPDKPGTTVETLDVLTRSLAGFDQKLILILNKADRFKKIHDFARTYGSLCWNLSKVIPRKDLPQIYTMYVPRQRGLADTVSGRKEEINANLNENRKEERREMSILDNERLFLSAGFYDLEDSRNDVIREVLSAPKKRIDNEITRISESAQLLSMHCTVLDAVAREFNSCRRRHWYQLLGVAGLAVVATTLVAFNYEAIRTVIFGQHSDLSLDGTKELSSLANSETSKDVSREIRKQAIKGVGKTVAKAINHSAVGITPSQVIAESAPVGLADHLLPYIRSPSFLPSIYTATTGLVSYLSVYSVQAITFYRLMTYLVSRKGLFSLYYQYYSKANYEDISSSNYADKQSYGDAENDYNSKLWDKAFNRLYHTIHFSTLSNESKDHNSDMRSENHVDSRFDGNSMKRSVNSTLDKDIGLVNRLSAIFSNLNQSKNLALNIHNLSTIQQVDIPALRRRASPSYPVLPTQLFDTSNNAVVTEKMTDSIDQDIRGNGNSERQVESETDWKDTAVDCTPDDTINETSQDKLVL